MRTRVDAFGAIVPPAGSIKFGPGQIHTLPGGGQIHFYPGGGGHFWPGPGGYNPNPQPQPPPPSAFQQQLAALQPLVEDVLRASGDGTLCNGSNQAVLLLQQGFNKLQSIAGFPERAPETGRWDNTTATYIRTIALSYGQAIGWGNMWQDVPNGC